MFQIYNPFDFEEESKTVYVTIIYNDYDVK